MITPFDAKLIAILAISAGSFLFGILPALFRLGSRCQQSTALSTILCFGGGVLLATSIVHILPDVRQDLPQWAEVIFCCGFFLIYFLDVIVQLIYNPSSQVFQETLSDEEENLLGSSSCEKYGSIPQVGPLAVPYEMKHKPSIVMDTAPLSDTWSCVNLGLLMAFSVHSLLEGLVIGVQTSPKGVFLILGAISCHKLLVAFCLGAELSVDGRPVYTIIPPISVFVIGSAMGIVIGMIIQNRDEEEMKLVVPVLQGIAGGTLLYVVVSEILPRERSRDLPSYAGLLQFLALALGFIVIVVLSFSF